MCDIDAGDDDDDNDFITVNKTWLDGRIFSMSRFLLHFCDALYMRISSYVDSQHWFWGVHVMCFALNEPSLSL